MDRDQVSFAQAEGVEALPTQLELKTISPELAALLWRFINKLLENYIDWSDDYNSKYIIKEPINEILRAWWVRRLYNNADEFPDPDSIKAVVKKVITSRKYVETFDFLQFVIRHPKMDERFATACDGILEEARAAYRVIGKTIVPVASAAEAQAVSAALAEVARSPMRGADAHLKNAARFLSDGDWPGAIRESIHAVEAAAKAIEPTAATLGPALDSLQESVGLNPALKRAFSNLYGFTCDEQGIRHSLVFNEEPKVTERDALFMFGACAAFVSYLVKSPR